MCHRPHMTPEPKIFTIWPLQKKKKKTSLIFDPDRKNLRRENKQSSSRFTSLLFIHSNFPKYQRCAEDQTQHFGGAQMNTFLLFGVSVTRI